MNRAEYGAQNAEEDHQQFKHRTEDHMLQEYDDLMARDTKQIQNVNTIKCRRHLADNGVLIYGDQITASKIFCYDEVPFMFVSRLERGGLIQTYRVVIAQETFQVEALHLETPCPKVGKNNPQGGFGQVEPVPGRDDLVKKIVPIRYPITNPTKPKPEDTCDPTKPEQQKKDSSELWEILREYCMAKRGGLRGYGPPIQKMGRFDLVFYSDHAQFAMERCVPLPEHIEKSPDFDVSAFEKRLIHCVRHMHHDDLVHMDIKPSNILYSSKSHTYYLADFGLTRAVEYGPGFRHAHDNSAFTPDFASPEMKEKGKVECVSGKPIDVHYQDSLSLTKTFEAVRNLFENRKGRKSPRTSQTTDQAARRETEKLISELSGLSEGNICRPSPLTKQYSWIAKYFPEFNGKRLDEKDIPLHPWILLRAIQLNFDVLEYHRHWAYSREQEEIIREMQTRVDEQFRNSADLSRLIAFCQQRRYNLLLKSLEVYFRENPNSGKFKKHVKCLLIQFDQELFSECSVEMLQRFYQALDGWREDILQKSKQNEYDKELNGIRERKLYLDLVAQNLPVDEIEQRLAQLQNQSLEQAQNHSSFSANWSSRDYDPESFAQVQSCNSGSYSQNPYAFEEQGNCTEEVSMYALENEHYDPMPSANISEIPAPEKDQHNQQRIIFQLAKLLHIRQEDDKAEYFFDQITREELKDASVPWKLALLERKYGVQAAVSLMKKELQRLEKNNSANLRLIAYISAKKQYFETLGQSSLVVQVPDQFQYGASYKLREEAGRLLRAGNFVESQKLFEECAAVVRLNSPSSELQWHELMCRAGELLVRNGERAKGFALLNRCVEAVRLAGGDMCMTLATCLCHFGDAYLLCSNRSQHHLLSAINYLKEAQNIFVKQTTHPHMQYRHIAILKSLGMCYYNLYLSSGRRENLSLSVDCYLKCLDFPIQRTQVEASQKVQILMHLSFRYFAMGEWEKAAQTMMKHLNLMDIFVNHLGNAPPLSPEQMRKNLNYLWISWLGIEDKPNDRKGQFEERLKELKIEDVTLKDRKKLMQEKKMAKLHPDLTVRVISSDFKYYAEAYPFESIKDRLRVIIAVKCLRRLLLEALPSCPKIKNDLLECMKAFLKMI